MIPRIRKLEHIDTVLRRLPQWRGSERAAVLVACKKRLLAMRRMNQIDAATLKEYNAKVLPELARAKIADAERKKAEANRVAVRQMAASPVLRAWYNAAVLGYGQLQG